MHRHSMKSSLTSSKGIKHRNQEQMRISLRGRADHSLDHAHDAPVDARGRLFHNDLANLSTLFHLLDKDIQRTR